MVGTHAGCAVWGGDYCTTKNKQRDMTPFRLPRLRKVRTGAGARRGMKNVFYVDRFSAQSFPAVLYRMVDFQSPLSGTLSTQPQDVCTLD